MAIAFDNSAQGSATSTSPLTWLHTCAGSNRIIFFSINTGSLSAVVTGVTYNGVAATKIGFIGLSGVQSMELWYLINPATGSNTVSVAVSSNTVEGSSASYTGAKQSGVPDSFNTFTGAANPTVSTTVVAANCWLVCAFGTGGAGATAGTGTTIRQSVVGPSYIGDSNATVGTGSQSMGWTTAATATAAVIASFAPFVAASANANFLAFM